MSKKQILQRVGQTKVIPISFKILLIFSILLLLSNIATNTINLFLNQRQVFKLNNEIMVSRLKDLYSAAGNQYQIFKFNGDKVSAVNSLKSVARKGFELPFSYAAAVDKEGKILFEICANGDELDENKIQRYMVLEADAAKQSENYQFADYSFKDKETLSVINNNFSGGIFDGSLTFETKNGKYFGVYKYQEDWQCYFIRAELRADTTRSTGMVMGVISMIIIILLGAFLLVGFSVFGRILANVRHITNSLYQMQQNQKLTAIDLSDSPNDDITYLAASFNSLSSTISNLLGIFQKFVSKDVVAKAYNEHQIRLEGKRRNLTILFSDIKSFTYRTETLGNDIIDLLNVHYDRVIHSVHENKGVIGSIIGDAILAIYGTDCAEQKSLDSLEAAWQITKLTETLRLRMIERRQEIERTRPLTESEEKVFQAVLIDVGVGIDGGNVFYGNIGSNEHMTNTVIGDNVNSASRLEGLTRIYHLPVICSQYIKDDVEQITDQYEFYEIDTVQVKGKTEGKKVYFPLKKSDDIYIEQHMKYEIFEEGLKEYYCGNWNEARKLFKKSELGVTEVFLERMGKSSAPADWSGIWTMTTK